MFSSSDNSLKIDRRLFSVEIRHSIAHCNALFQAGAITRPEAERLKNGLWTVLKRADFDRSYFDNADSQDVYAFIETRLFQLVNEAANQLKIGRSRPHRRAVALRLWLRDAIETLVESIESLTEVLPFKPDQKVFVAFIESFKRDETRLREIARRTNQMPCPSFDGQDETTAEIDFVLIAHELEFEKVLENSLDSASDRDFCVEFTGAAALVGLHLSNLANEILTRLNTDDHQRQVLETVRGKAVQTFGYQTILLSLLKGLLVDSDASELDEVCEIVFNAADALRFCLSAVASALKNLS